MTWLNCQSLIIKFSSARPCNKHGNFLDDDEAPPPLEPYDPTDWTPFTSRYQFETAEFLFQRAKMSAGNIDELLELWAAPSGEAPFIDHVHLYNTIDAIPVGGVPWQSFSVSYTGPRPETDVPPWMEETYEVYFRDPHQLFVNMLANPTFAQDFDYTPMQQFNTNGSRQYQHFMSGDWAWKQAVGLCSVCHSHFANFHTTGRTSSQSKFQTQMVLCSLRSLSAAIRPQCLLQQVKTNTGLCTHQLATFITMSDEHMGVG